MKILIVDDESNKIGHIKNVLKTIDGIIDNNIEIALEIGDARKLLSKNYYDLLILDIQLPTTIGDDIHKDGGLSLLEDIRILDKIIKPKYIIGLSSFEEETISEFSEKLLDNFLHILEYNPKLNDWKRGLTSYIEYILAVKRQVLQNNDDYEYDVAIITAVDIEHKKVKYAIDANWTPIYVNGDPTEYFSGVIMKRDKPIRLITATQHQMGMTAASTLSMKLIQNFRPRYLVMVGIAAGNKKQGVELGDIIVASESWDYGSGKLKEGSDQGFVFQPAPIQISLYQELKEKFLKDHSQALFKIFNNYQPRQKNMLSLHVGPMASGAAVIQDENVVKKYIDEHNRKLLGIEMETYGVYYAANNAPKPNPKFFSIKSVCDFADASKNDDFQDYAAYTSVKFLEYFIINELDF